MDKWTWATGTPAERAQMVRSHTGLRRPLSRFDMKRLFNLTDAGLDAILAGSDWKPEHDAGDTNNI